MERHTKIKLLSTIIVIGFAIASFYHYIMGAYLGNQFPLNTFLFGPNDKFNDFWNMVRFIRELNPYRSDIYIFGIYYPLGELFFFPFTLFKSRDLALLVFLSIFLVCWLFFITKNFSQTNRLDNFRDIFVISFMSYPFLFTIDRANAELYTFLFLCGFAYFYNSFNHYKSLFALICLSLAIAMKPFPAIFLVLLASEKKWKNILYVIIFAALITIFSLLCFQGSILENIQGLRRNQAMFVQDYVIGSGGWPYGVSLFGLIKVIAAFVLKISKDIGIISSSDIVRTFFDWVSLLLRPYSVLSLIIVGLVSLYILTKEKIFWKKLALLVFVMNVIPPTSGDYRLLNLFIPSAFFINESKSSKFDLAYLLLFGLLLIPKNYFIIPAMTDMGLSIGVIINPLLMLIFGFLIIKEGLSKTTRDIPKQSLDRSVRE